MKLINTQTKEVLIGEVRKISLNDLKSLKTNNNFKFDWSKESKYIILQVSIVNESEILGLMSIIDVSREFRVHINLIESSKKYRGKSKLVDNIPGCLISYACKLAFEKGYDGFVSLIPKTQLIEYYHKKFGFVQIGAQMAVFDDASRLIVLKYQGDEEI